MVHSQYKAIVPYVKMFRRNRITQEQRQRIVQPYENGDEDYLLVADTLRVNRSTARGMYSGTFHQRRTNTFQWRSQPDIWSCKCKFFCVYRPYKESISKEMNNDNDLNLHLHDQMSG